MKGRGSSAVSAAALALPAELRKSLRPIAMLSLGDQSVDVRAGHDFLWPIIRRNSGPDSGGIALRLAHCWGGCACIRRTCKS